MRTTENGFRCHREKERTLAFFPLVGNTLKCWLLCYCLLTLRFRFALFSFSCSMPRFRSLTIVIYLCLTMWITIYFLCILFPFGRLTKVKFPKYKYRKPKKRNSCIFRFCIRLLSFFRSFYSFSHFYFKLVNANPTFIYK